MKRNTEQTDPITSWWLPARILKQPEVFPNGFCSHAEHWHLALLILISNDRQLQTDGLKMLLRNAYAVRMDTSKKVNAPGIVKLHARSGGNQYDLGYNSFLITQGVLAGTLAKASQKRDLLKRGKLQLQTIRPVFHHRDLMPELEIDIDTHAGVNDHVTALLEQTYTQILRRGYIQALLHYLNRSGIKHSKRAILANQQELEKYIA